MSYAREEYLAWAEERKCKFGEHAIDDAAARLTKLMNDLEVDILTSEALGEAERPERKIMLERIMDAIERINTLQDIERRGAA